MTGKAETLVKGLRQVAAAVCCALVLCGGALHADARDVLRVGIRPLGDGGITQDAQGNFYGLETDFMQTLASYAGMDATFVPGTWEENVARLDAGDIDTIAGVPQSPPFLGRFIYARLPLGAAHGDHGLMMSIETQHLVTPLYYVMRPENGALFARLEQANDNMAANRPHFIDDLARMYRERTPIPVLRLTADERAFLQQHPVIHAVAVLRERPYAYYDENGAFAGEVRKLADRIAYDLGVTVDIETVESHEEAFRAIADGTADIVLNMDWDISYAETKGLSPTIPFDTYYYTVVKRRGSDLAHPVVACLDSRMTDEVLRARYADEQLQTYPNIEAGLRAVQSGAADLMFLRQETAQYEIWQGAFPDLVSDGTVVFSRQESIGVSKRVAQSLLPILDKEIGYIGPNVLKDYLATHDGGAAKRLSLRSLIYAYPVYFLGGLLAAAVVALLLIYRYIRVRRRHTDEIQALVDTDSYTGLHSHRWFEHGAAEIAAAPLTDGHAWYVVAFGIPNVDTITGMYGQETVSRFVTKFARALERAPWARLTATHASIGHVLCLAATADAEVLAEEVRAFKEAQEYIAVGAMNVHIRVRAGIRALDFPPMDIRKALEQANLAIHDEEDDVRVYNEEMQQEALQKSQIENLQQVAAEREEFQIWLQPKYDLKTKRCIGAEALVRWQSRELGFLPPGKFIPLFERNGFISELDFYNLEHVMKYQKARRAAGLPIVPISVNQSRYHMQEQGYLARMEALVTRYGTDGVELELTETAFDLASREQRENALTVVTALHELGFRIDMDDFGSGYSDLTLLDALPLDVMKLDRSLLLASENSDRMKSVLARMTDLGHALGMTVICEGIETEAQEQMLIACGCEHGQGYLYGKPMPQEEFAHFLENHL